MQSHLMINLRFRLRVNYRNYVLSDENDWVLKHRRVNVSRDTEGKNRLHNLELDSVSRVWVHCILNCISKHNQNAWGIVQCAENMEMSRNRICANIASISVRVPIVVSSIWTKTQLYVLSASPTRRQGHGLCILLCGASLARRRRRELQMFATSVMLLIDNATIVRKCWLTIVLR